MRVEIGQIPLPAPEAIANPLRAVVDIVLTGIMVVVLAEVLVLTAGAAPQPQVPIPQGIILPLAPALNKPVEVVNGLIGEHAPAGPPAIPIHPFPEQLAPLGHLQGHVLLDLTG